MENQKKLIEIFCKDAKYYRVTYDNNGTEFGKIIENKELSSVNLDTNEIRRSIEYTNDDRLFVLDLKPTLGELSDNSLQLVTNNLYEARAIEMVYPNVFTWVFDDRIQAIGRSDGRIGQTATCRVVDLVVKDTIDEKILGVVLGNQKIADLIMEKGARGVI